MNKVASVEMFLKEIEKYQPANINNVTMFYRGDGSNKELIPKVFSNINAEHVLIKEMLTNHPDNFVNRKTTFEQLALMQHYECPTRLLDITTNPLVALYFACGNCEELDKSVYVIIIDNSLIKHSGSDSVSILSNIAKLTPEQLDNDRKTVFKNKPKYGQTNHTHECMNYLLGEINHENPAFKNIINFTDLDNKILCVKPPYNDPRMIAQQGAFLLYGVKNIDKRKFASLREQDGKIIVHEIEIDKKILAHIKDELRIYSGITPEKLFPEILTTAHELSSTYLPDFRKIGYDHVISAKDILKSYKTPDEAAKNYYWEEQRQFILDYQKQKFDARMITVVAYFNLTGIKLKPGTISDEQFRKAYEHIRSIKNGQTNPFVIKG